MLTSHYDFLMNSQIVFQSAYTMLPSHQSWFLCILNQSLVSLFNLSHSIRCVTVSPCVFNLHFLMTNDVGHLFISLFAIHVYSLVKCLFKDFARFKTGFTFY